MAERRAGRPAEEGAAVARRTAHAPRRRRGGLVLAGAARRGRPNAKAVFYKALLRVNPCTPGRTTNSSTSTRTSGGPRSAGRTRRATSSRRPGIPHAFHMQAHLGMRIGKWGVTTDWSWRAIELQMAYHKHQGVKPGEDHQFNHHMETLTRSLVHDGRFAEAKKIKAKAEGYKYSFRPEWFRMALDREATGTRPEADRAVPPDGQGGRGVLRGARVRWRRATPSRPAARSTRCGSRSRPRRPTSRSSGGCGRCRAGTCARRATARPG